MDRAKAPPLGELRKFILAITTRRVSEVRLVPRSRFGLRFAEKTETMQFPFTRLRFGIVLKSPLLTAVQK